MSAALFLREIVSSSSEIRVLRTRGCAAIAVVAMAAASASAGPQDFDDVATYFRALRERGLLTVAERYAADRLTEERLPIAERVAFSVELSRTYSQHASQTADPAEREEFRGRAEDALAPLLDRAEDFPRRDAVTFQQVVLQADRAEWLHWQSQVDGGDPQSDQAAVTSLRDADHRMQSWVDEFMKRRSAAGRMTDEDLEAGVLTPRERNSMRREAELRLASLELALAELAMGEARDASLASARERLNALRRTTSGSVWESTVEIARLKLLRLAGDHRALESAVQSLLNRDLEPEARAAAIAEFVRDRIDAKEFESATAFLRDTSGGTGTVADELRALHIEILLAVWHDATPERRAEIWKGILQEQSRIGGPWQARANAIIHRAEGIDHYGLQGFQQVQSAGGLYRGGKRTQAARAYAAAAETARKAGHSAAADDLAYTAASVFFEAGQLREAIEFCRPLITGAGDRHRRAEASLLSAYCRARLLDARPSAAGESEYAAALQAHLEQFEGDPTSADAAMMLGAIRLREQEFTAAIESFRRVDPESARGSVAKTAIVAAFGRTVRQLRANQLDSLEGRPASAWTEEAQREARALLESVAPGATLTPEQGARLIAGAQTLLLAGGPDFNAIDVPLGRVLESARRAESDEKPAPGEWNDVVRDATACLLVSLSRQQRFEEAGALLAQLPTADPRQILDVLSALDAATGELDRTQEIRLGQLQLAAIGRIEASQTPLAGRDRRLLTLSRASALQRVGRASEAAPIYEELLTSNAGDREALVALARLQAEIGNNAEATKRWLQLQKGERPGSAPWLDASFEVARSLIREGKPRDALKLIQSIRIVYPEMSDSDRRRFAELADDAGR